MRPPWGRGRRTHLPHVFLTSSSRHHVVVVFLSSGARQVGQADPRDDPRRRAGPQALPAPQVPLRVDDRHRGRALHVQGEEGGDGRRRRLRGRRAPTGGSVWDERGGAGWRGGVWGGRGAL